MVHLSRVTQHLDLKNLAHSFKIWRLRRIEFAQSRNKIMVARQHHDKKLLSTAFNALLINKY